MKKIRTIFSSIIILSSISLAVEGEAVNVNEKYQFINDIYSESWALIIGINKYQNVDPLTYAVDDAVAVKEMLVDKYGFKEGNIKLITDEEATKDNILKGFSDILTQAKEKDRVIVFYAGHGETYKLPSGGDKGYLIPVDGDLDNLFLSSIAMKQIYEIADMSYAKHILYLVDACYGGLTLAATRGLKKDTTPEYVMKMTKERGRQVITAGGKDEEVIEKAEWGHSAFTKSLLNGLDKGFADENMDGIITADELGGFIKNRVMIDVDGAHTPQQGRIGSDMGEFVFISKNAEEQFAAALLISDGDGLSNLQSEVVELKQKLRLKNVGSTSYNMKTASTFSWVFPGLGHYYAGKTNKGFLFTGLELAALAGVFVTSSNYLDKVDEYETATTNYDNFSPSTYQGDNVSQEKDNLGAMMGSAYDDQQSAMYALIGTGTVSAGIWLWNVMDIKKSNSHSDNMSVRINSRGQVEARISF